MNAPMRWSSTEGAARRVLAETNRVAAPCAADRERITEALRARLGAVVLPEGVVPAAGAVTRSTDRSAGAPSAARVGLGRGGWLSVVVGTGVVAGALGFVLGYGTAERERGAAIDGAGGVVAASARGVAPDGALGVEGAGKAAAEVGGKVAAEVAVAAEAGGGIAAEAGAGRGAFGSGRAAPVRRRAPVERAERAAASERRGSPAPEARGLSFAEVLERVQRANVALRQGHAALALIQLAELDRGAGEVLREEREATRALALCAIGDTAGARRVAAPLLAGGASSIYAPRLDASCAREDESSRD
jgi:hypothetical protein